MDQIWQGVVTIAVAIIGVAILAVLVSPKAQTSTVLNAAGSSFATALSAATAPVTGTAGSVGSALTMPNIA